MKLQYALPAWAAALTGIDPQAVRYCVPYDLAPDGTLLKNGYLVVTRERLLVLGNERVLEEVLLERGTKIVCSPQVDCGLLLAWQEDGERFLCRFSMRHMVRISYVAKGATLLAEGVDRPVESRERELHCEKCGRILPGAALCPNATEGGVWG